MGEQGTPSGWPPPWPDITDPDVLAAVAAVPRHLFVPPAYREDAYLDMPQPIGCGQTISQPYIVALMTQALCLGPHSRVLEIGTGSGYQAAVLASITRHVWSVERRAELAEKARERLEGLGYSVEVLTADGCRGWADHAPYDGILVTAAGREVPPALVAQLAPGGRLVIPVGGTSWDQVLWLVERRGERLTRRALAEVRFVPLVPASGTRGEEDEALAAIRRQLGELFGEGRD